MLLTGVELITVQPKIAVDPVSPCSGKHARLPQITGQGHAFLISLSRSPLLYIPRPRVLHSYPNADLF